MSRLIVNQIQGDAVSKEIEIPTGHVLKAADTAGLVVPGGLVQIKQSIKTATQSISTAWVFTKISDLTVSITPKLSNSTFVITASIHTGTAYYSYGYKIYKDGSEIDVKGGADGVKTRVAFGGVVYDGNGGNEDHEVRNEAYTYVYESTAPAGTSIDFDIYGSGYSGSYPIHINRSADDANDTSRIRTTSSLTVMEIAA